MPSNGTWFKVYKEVLHHPKLDKLARKLKVSRYGAVGVLVSLWGWALDYARDGDLSKYDDDDVAGVVGWDGDSKALIAALVDSGWMDADRRIHDWYQGAGDTVLRLGRDAERARKDRAAKKRNGDVAPTSHARTPQQTVQTKTGETRQDAITAYEDAMARPVTPAEADTLMSWLEDYAEDWIVDAIKEAVNNNVRKLSYIGRILENWKEKGKGSGKGKAKEQTVAVAPKDCTGCDLVGKCGECPRGY